MLESRRSYGYGMVSPAGTGYDWLIEKDGIQYLVEDHAKQKYRLRKRLRSL